MVFVQNNNSKHRFQNLETPAIAGVFERSRPPQLLKASQNHYYLINFKLFSRIIVL